MPRWLGALICALTDRHRLGQAQSLGPTTEKVVCERCGLVFYQLPPQGDER